MTVTKKIKTGYKGNERLRPDSMQIELDEFQLNEMKRCKADYRYFIENYMYITNLDNGEVLFKLHKFQKRMLRSFHESRRTVCMVGRQCGKTITTAAYILWYVLFKSNQNVYILANKSAGAREILFRIQYSYERLPLWMQSGIKTWNKGSIWLSNECRITTAATSRSGIRGQSVNLLYLDEAAIIENNIADDFFAAISPTLASGSKTKMIVTSTPKGYNHFWHMWDGANKQTNNYCPIFIPHTDVPGRDEVWLKEQRKELGELKFRQEILCEFQGSSLTLLSGDALSRLNVGAPIYEDEEGLAIFEAPNMGTRHHASGMILDPAHIYFVVVDVSRGVGGDYSTCMVVDTTTVPYKLVARYRNNTISPLLFPSIVNKLAIEYNMAFVLVEINENGQQIADILHDELAYENILTVSRNGTKGQTLSNGFGRLNSTQMGVKTSKQVKSIGCGALKTLMEESKLLIDDAETIKEFSTFIEQRGSYAADVGYHDDLVMPLVLFGWITTQMFFKDLTNISLREKIFESRIANIRDRFTPFMYKDDGRQPEKPISGDYIGFNSLNGNMENMMNMSTEDMEDLQWLLGKSK